MRANDVSGAREALSGNYGRGILSLIPQVFNLPYEDLGIETVRGYRSSTPSPLVDEKRVPDSIQRKRGYRKSLMKIKFAGTWPASFVLIEESATAHANGSR
jgi:hypothetical protein